MFTVFRNGQAIKLMAIQNLLVKKKIEKTVGFELIFPANVS